MSDYDDAYATTDTRTESASTIAERYVIGALLADPRNTPAVQRVLEPGDFHDMRLGAIYQGILTMLADGKPVDYLTVWDMLPEWDVRGIDLADLSGWASSLPTATSGGYYAQLVRDASVTRQVQLVGRRLLEPGRNAATVIEDARDQLLRIRDRDTGEVGVRWLRDVLNVPESDDDYDWVISDVLERQDRLMLSAGEGVGKSTLLRQFAVLSAAGIHPFKFCRMEPIRVLVVDAENSERQWRRATRDLAERAMERGLRDPRGHIGLHCVGVMDITKSTDLGRLHKWIDEVDPHMVVLGPLYRMVGGNPMDKDTDVAPVLAALESIRERNVAMVIEVHAGHARSSQGERELRPRGSSALLGWPEFGLGLRKNKGTSWGQKTYSLVRWRGDRDRRHWPTLVHGLMWPWEPTGDTDGGH